MLNRGFWGSVALALLAFTVFWPVISHDFINYDDPDYVTSNQHIRPGLTSQGLSWAFGRLHGEQTYWHPLTWVSHMVDCQLFGLNPVGHHLVNLLFHTLNTVLVFLVFRRMTGAFWRCAVLAGLFALHPLQVDTVAWVAERKNLLSTLFWLLTMWAYACYARKKSAASEPGPGVESQGPESGASRFTFHISRPLQLPTSIYYSLALLFFALGLMCKPVLVTLPAVLLLMDYWPLERLWPSMPNRRPATFLSLVAEKAPFLVLAVASSVITIASHHALKGMMNAAAGLPLEARIENALVSYVRYLGKTVWPSHLAVFYPHPVSWPIWTIALSGLMLLALSVLAVSAARRHPYLFVGWFWFLGVLVPFIGVIQAGAQAMADRFAYVPLIGLFLALVWGAHEAAGHWRYRTAALSGGVVVAVLLCGFFTRRQLSYWKDGQTLFEHAIAVTGHNDVAHYNLGVTLANKGLLDEAIPHYEAAARFSPEDPEPHDGLGYVLASKGKIVEAIEQYREALRLDPCDARAHNNLGNLLAKQGHAEEALQHFTESLRLDAKNPEARNNLGIALAKQGRLDEAISQFQEVTRVNPDHAGAHRSLGLALAAQQKLEAAADEYRHVLRLRPDDARARAALGGLLVQQGRLDGAIEQLTEAVRSDVNDSESHYLLGLAFARKKDWIAAGQHFRSALALDPKSAAACYQLGLLSMIELKPGLAIEHWRQAARLDPKWPEPLNNLAWILATHPDSELRDGPEAVRLATRAAELSATNNPGILDTLAAAYAETGRFAEAIKAIQEALELAETAHATNAVAEFRSRLSLYRSQKPYRAE